MKIHLPRSVNNIVSITVAIAIVFALSFYFLKDASAAPPTSRSDVMSRLAASTNSSHDITFTMTGSVAFDAGDTITVDFDEDGGNFTVDGASMVAADFDLNDGVERTIVDVDGSCVSHSGTNDVVVGINDTTGVITFTACASFTSSSSGATLNLEIGSSAASGTDNITNPGSAGEIQIAVGGSYGDDSAGIAIDIVADDQVSVTAAVDETMNFAISDNSIGFGTLNSGAARYATGDLNGSASETEAHTMTAGTNASGGFAISLNGATLTSGSDTIDAIGAANTASSPGTEQFGVRATVSGGSGAVSAPYAAAGFAFDTGAFPDEVGASAAGSDDSTYSVRYLGNIRSNTEAGSYTATLTYIATGTF